LFVGLLAGMQLAMSKGMPEDWRESE
jgi:hypothetical protein